MATIKSDHILPHKPTPWSKMKVLKKPAPATLKSMYVPPPEPIQSLYCEGWEILPDDAIVKHKDVAVDNDDEDIDGIINGDADASGELLKVSLKSIYTATPHTVGKLISLLKTGGWGEDTVVLRRCRKPLIGNAHYSEPLPLP